MGCRRTAEAVLILLSARNCGASPASIRGKKTPLPEQGSHGVLFQYHTDNLDLYLRRKCVKEPEQRITVYVIDILG